jgi:hypothetical protein
MSKMTRKTIIELHRLALQRGSRVDARWKRISGCEKRRLEPREPVLLKFLASRKSLSTRNGTNTKSGLQSICKLRGGRSA